MILEGVMLHARNSRLLPSDMDKRVMDMTTHVMGPGAKAATAACMKPETTMQHEVPTKKVEIVDSPHLQSIQI